MAIFWNLPETDAIKKVFTELSGLEENKKGHKVELHWVSNISKATVGLLNYFYLTTALRLCLGVFTHYISYKHCEFLSRSSGFSNHRNAKSKYGSSIYWENISKGAANCQCQSRRSWGDLLCSMVHHSAHACSKTMNLKCWFSLLSPSAEKE